MAGGDEDVSEDDEDRQWTEEARSQVAGAAGALIQAVRAHAETVVAMTGRRAEVRDLFPAHEALARAVLVYDEAVFDFTGTSLPLVSTDEDEEEDDGEEEDGEAEAVAHLAVLRRTDYRVTDLDAVLAAGRRAYLRVWPDDTQEDAEVDVEDLGRALYQVAHAGGWEDLQEVEGLRAVRGVTLIVAVDEGPGSESEEPLEDPFALAPGTERAQLYREDDIY